MIHTTSISLTPDEIRFFILGLLKDPNDLVTARMISDALTYPQIEALLKYKLAKTDPYAKMLPQGTRCWVEPKNISFITGSKLTKEDFFSHESMKQGYIPVIVDKDEDYASESVRLILPALNAEICQAYTYRSYLIVDEEFDLSRNQTDESKEELGPF